ncbi:MAG TPA: hypothetical protein VHA56_02105 [Mucilaginibacter sp.]|nr:hypothetical protein [Mucilaginibacter sp.]
MLIPKEVFEPRRQHRQTPEAIKLIIVNFVVVSVGETLFFSPGHINWFFWVAIALLGLYNFFSLRRNLEVYSKTDKITFVVSMAVLVVLTGLVYYYQ